MNMVVHSLDFVRSVVGSVKSGSRLVAESIIRLTDCIISMSDIISDVLRGEEVWRRVPESVVVSEIFRRLPARDVARARCVCRSWNSLLTSSEFRNLWCFGPCADIEPWMGSGGTCEPLPELKWAAVTHRHCPVPPDMGWAYDAAHRKCAATAKQDIEVDSDGETSIPLKICLTETFELASSHGLVCLYWQAEGRILVGNHRTRKWKLLPPFPAGGRKERYRTWAHEAYSVRFVRHDLLQQTYMLFFLEIFQQSDRVLSHLYDSSTCSWQPISRHSMPRDRFCSGIRDGSVVVVGYHYVNSVKELRMEGSNVDEVGILAYDFCNNSWDEITTTLLLQEEHSSNGNPAEVEVEGICFRHRQDEMDGYRISPVFLCANAKDEYCRLVVVDGAAGVMCLWQLEQESCTVFQLVSTVQLRPKRPWKVVKDPYDRNRYTRAVASDSMAMSTWIIRSDATLFMAMVVYGHWSWLVIYDVGRSSWLTAHAYGDLSALDCGLTCCCRWPLLDYDVGWHDGDHEEVQDDVESPLMPLRGRLRPNLLRCAVTAAALGRQPSRPRRLHLVCVPDIWSTP